MNLYHYFDKNIGPFKNLSDLEIDEAKELLENIKRNRPNCQCAKRQPSYVEDRLYYENILRNEFQKKGGKIERQVPHYMVVEHSPWLSTWYDNSGFIKIPIEEFDLSPLSFTYGDSHPTFSPRVNDGKEYRKNYILMKKSCKSSKSMACHRNGMTMENMVPNDTLRSISGVMKR